MREAGRALRFGVLDRAARWKRLCARDWHCRRPSVLESNVEGRGGSIESRLPRTRPAFKVAVLFQMERDGSTRLPGEGPNPSAREKGSALRVRPVGRDRARGLQIMEKKKGGARPKSDPAWRTVVVRSGWRSWRGPERPPRSLSFAPKRAQGSALADRASRTRCSRPHGSAPRRILSIVRFAGRLDREYESMPFGLLGCDQGSDSLGRGSGLIPV